MRRAAIILAIVGATLLLPLISLHVAALTPGTNLAVVAPSIAIGFYVATLTGLVLIACALGILLFVRRRRVP